MTRGTKKAHLARATLEAIALQVDDLIVAMREESPVTRLRVDGGAAANDLLMQFQSDISGLTVERPEELETTARGAAMLAGIGAGIFKSGTEAAQMVKALREQGGLVWYMNALNEGHGYRKKENRDVYQQATVLFLRDHLL